MAVPPFLRLIARPSIGSHRAAVFDHRSNGDAQRGSGGITDCPHANSAYALLALVLGGNKDERLSMRAPPLEFPAFSADENFINFHQSGEPVPVGPHHATANLLQELPAGFLPPDTKNARKAEGAYAVLLRNNAPDCQKPQLERKAAMGKNCPLHHRKVRAASSTSKISSPNGPGRGAVARRASGFPTPAHLTQISKAIIFGCEATQYLLHCFGIRCGHYSNPTKGGRMCLPLSIECWNVVVERCGGSSHRGGLRM